jgi:hypothetical protein
MMLPMMVMLASFMSEEEIMSHLKDNLAKYEASKSGGGNIDKLKGELGFYMALMMIKLNPKSDNPFEAMKEVMQHEEWMKMKPNDQ